MADLPVVLEACGARASDEPLIGEAVNGSRQPGGLPATVPPVTSHIGPARERDESANVSCALPVNLLYCASVDKAVA
jgi:hypothetical protein